MVVENGKSFLKRAVAVLVRRCGLVAVGLLVRVELFFIGDVLTVEDDASGRAELLVVGVLYDSADFYILTH